MKDKSLKQISTNVIPQGNVPNVPDHLQTGTYYPEASNAVGATETPSTTQSVLGGFSEVMPWNSIKTLNQNDFLNKGTWLNKNNHNPMMGGGNYPLAQTKRTGEYYDKSTIDYTGVPSDKIPTYEQGRKINKINLMSGKGPNLDSISKVGGSTSDALRTYYSGDTWRGDIEESTNIYKSLSKEEKDKL